MKVFLSHSSKDQAFVQAVADQLRPGTFELDAQTFDAGLINSAAIVDALKRCDLFCLFLSENSVNSSYVDFETLLGIEFVARGLVSKFLVICLDDDAFGKANNNVKFFNVIRRQMEVESAARLIQGNLISAAAVKEQQAHPFIGRSNELQELERQATDHRRPQTKVVFVSGNFGSGRRTVAKKFYEDQYPHVGRVFPEIKIDVYSGLEELHRKVLFSLRPTMRATELKTRIQAFIIASDDEKRRQIADLLNSLLLANEAVQIIDLGGVLTDAGALEPEINGVISELASKPHPPVTVISPRMIPLKLRRAEDDIAYLALRSLSRETSERLISRLLKDRGVVVSVEQLSQLVALGDGHPFNIYRMVEELEQRGAAPFLANPGEFVEWKHRQSSEYLTKINLTNEDILTLGLLKLIPELDFSALSSALQISPEVMSETLSRLTTLHIVDGSAERFMISPPLRIAVEKDGRVVLPKAIRLFAIQTVAETLSVRLEEGSAPIALIDSAVLAALERRGELPDFAAAFLLPSHQVWLSKLHYDERSFEESIYFANEALKGGRRLSSNAMVTACRYKCLSAARIGDSTAFDEGVARLEAAAHDDWAQSNISFLRGFNFRLKGNVPKAHEAFLRSYELSPGNISAAREIASICLAREKLEEAETFAREAYGHAATNPYVVEILISVLVRRHGRSAAHIAEMNELFEVLQSVGEEGGKSFYTTRKAEFEHLCGNNKTALRLIEQAMAKTPSIFEPKRLYVEILLKEGNKTKAHDILKLMEAQVNARDPSERRSNYRAYLVTRSNYLASIGQFNEAKQVYGDTSVFTDDERVRAVKEVDTVQAYMRN